MTKRRRNGRNVSIVATICVWFKKHGSKRMIRIALIFFLHLSITYQAALKCSFLQLATEDILLFMASGDFCNFSGNGLISKRETIMES